MEKKLYRSRTNRVIGGVAAGIGAYLEVDPVLIRVLWALLFFLRGTGLLLYIIAWIIIPEEPVPGIHGRESGFTTDEPGTAPDHLTTGELSEVQSYEENAERRRKILGGALIALGVISFLHELAPRWINTDIIWPIGLIGAGLVILARRK